LQIIEQISKNDSKKSVKHTKKREVEVKIVTPANQLKIVNQNETTRLDAEYINTF
jgi:hypothetical protein